MVTSRSKILATARGTKPSDGSAASEPPPASTTPFESGPCRNTILMADHTYLGVNSGLVTGSSPLEALVRDLNEQAKAFAGYLRGNGLPEPSFERSAPIVNLSPQAPEEVRMAREKLLDNALQIFQLIAGPGEYLPHLVEGVSKRPPPHTASHDIQSLSQYIQ